MDTREHAGFMSAQERERRQKKSLLKSSLATMWSKFMRRILVGPAHHHTIELVDHVDPLFLQVTSLRMLKAVFKVIVINSFTMAMNNRGRIELAKEATGSLMQWRGCLLCLNIHRRKVKVAKLRNHTQERPKQINPPCQLTRPADISSPMYMQR